MMRLLAKSEHQQQVAAILYMTRSQRNDKYVALQFLKLRIAAKAFCLADLRDTGTAAIIMGKANARLDGRRR